MRHSVNRRVNIVEMSFPLKLIYRYNVLLVNVTDFYAELNKHSKGFIEVKGSRIAKRLFKNKKSGLVKQ